MRPATLYSRLARFARPALAALVTLALTTSTAASSFRPVDLPDLTRQSDAVVHARVAEVESAWNEDHSFIFTRARLEIIGTLWGPDRPAQLDIRLPGGSVDGYTAEMIGAPTLVQGEEVVLFLARWDDGVAMIAGYAEGVSRLSADAAGNLVLRGGVADGLPLAALADALGRIQR